MALKYLKNVSTLRVDSNKCIGCQTCIQVCPHQLLSMQEGKAIVLDRDACMECGACANNCPADAISVRAGVGCAYAVIRGLLTGSPPSCDCSGGDGDSCC